MIGLFQVDITEARRLLATSHPPGSLTAYVVACVARAAAKHPEVHAYRDSRGRLVEHRQVDVQVLIEVPSGQGPFGLVHIVRDADVRSGTEISAEIRAVKVEPRSTRNGRALDALPPALGRVPGLCRAMYAVMSRSHRVHNAIGTVQVTAPITAGLPSVSRRIAPVRGRVLDRFLADHGPDLLPGEIGHLVAMRGLVVA